ncbi:hypothetical protein M9458_057354 [Cirrhinus mrigala]|uniref:Uncharacterized protein n=1 Tax=Cirrhinus mrigala TaxID=683832 RepID=A0ABD0MF11_CIRMR
MWATFVLYPFRFRGSLTPEVALARSMGDLRITVWVAPSGELPVLPAHEDVKMSIATSAERRGAGSVGCALLAHPDLVCRPHAPRDSPSLEDSPEEGPLVVRTPRDAQSELSPSTLKVFVAAIAAYHDAVDGLSLGKHHLIVRLNPPRPHLIPSWDLSVVLLGLRRVPSEPPASVELKYLSLKMALLIALISIKRVGDLHAFSVSESCLEFGPADSHVTLRPRSGYVPKVPTTPFRDRVVNLQALPPEETDPALALSCPVRVLRTYVDRTWSFRRSEQLLLALEASKRGMLSSSRGWLIEWLMPSLWLTSARVSRAPLDVASSWAPPGLSSRHLQSCGLGDTKHLHEILQSPRRARLLPCVKVTSGNLWEDGSVSACCTIPIGSVRFLPVVPFNELWVLLVPTVRIRTEFSGLCPAGTSFTPPGRGIMSQSMDSSMFPYHVFQYSPRDFFLVILLYPWWARYLAYRALGRLRVEIHLS